MSGPLVMTGPLVQCVPNFSEGRDAQVLAAIAEAASVRYVRVANFSADVDHNRCVLTLVGPPQAVLQACAAACAVADAFVQQSTPTTNFGMAPTVRVKQGGPVRIAYLKFDIASLAAKEGRVASATLRLYGGNRASGYNAYDTAYAVPDTSWTEGGLTYANRPAPGLRQGTCLSFTAAHYVEWDVTGWVDAQRAAGKSVVSLAVEMDAPPAGAEPDIFNCTKRRQAGARCPSSARPPLQNLRRTLARTPRTGRRARQSWGRVFP